MMRAIKYFSMNTKTVFAFALLLVAACGELTGPKSPSTPTNVTATLQSGTSVIVTWTPSPLNDGVVSYSVFRNGTKVGESTTTSYTDTGLPQLQTFKYTVAANCTSGLISDQSAETAAATVVTRDVTPPTVTGHQPPTGFVGVSSAGTATVTFSEAIDPATINTTTFTLKLSDGTSIPGTVTYTAATRTAEFKPTSTLPNPVLITATVTTGVKDVAGNALAANFSWSFTTRDDTPPTVIATVPADGAAGVSPTAPLTVTFSEAMDITTITAANITLKVTSSGAAVPGTVSYAAATRIATFTPNSPLAQSTGYTLTVSGAVKDTGGNQMGTARVITFTTGDTTPPTVLSVSPANLATNVSPTTAVQVTFSEPMLASSITASTIFLTNSVTSAVVPAIVSYNLATHVATLAPTISLAGSTTYSLTVTTGVKDASGNSLAAAFNSVFTTAVVDTTPPTVTAVSPADGATSVAINTAVQVTFSEPMDSATVNASTFTLRNTATSALIPATVVYNRTTRVATLSPTAALFNATNYTVTVTTGVKDVAGNALASPFTSTFTTAPAPDTTRPTITARSPADSATGVALIVAPTVTFSEAMDTTSINSTTIRLSETVAGTQVAGAVTYNTTTRIATFTPSAPLKNNTRYTLTLTTGVKDLAGNTLLATSTSVFTTVADTIAPTIIATSPVNGTTGVAVGSPVRVTFSEDMDNTTITSTTFRLNVTTGGAAVAGTVSYNAATRVATFTPASTLVANTNYTATVTTGVKDVAGNPLATNATFAFTTAP